MSILVILVKDVETDQIAKRILKKATLIKGKIGHSTLG